MACTSESTVQLNISVRGLAEAQSRSGGLAGTYYGGVDGLAGIRTHQRYFEMLAADERVSQLATEQSLSESYISEDTRLLVKGRADAWFYSGDDLVLAEVKSFRGDAARLPRGGEAVHWDQAKLYAYMLLILTGNEKLVIELTYVSAETDETIILKKDADFASLESFFHTICRSFVESTRSLRRYLAARNDANKAAAFAYDSLRKGQKALMRRVMDSMLSTGILLANAPTGIGKTIATLYPALKAQANGKIDRIFYLTHTTSTRLVAADALADLRAAGFLIRAITLYAKESLCLEPDLFCDLKRCPYAVEYYDRVPEALSALYRLQAINPDNLLPVAKKHRVCPFELSLDVSMWCDIIIADYNYCFDPRVRLQRHFGDEHEVMALLVDEAHNLPARAREMYSARIRFSDLTNVYTLLKSNEQAPPCEGQPSLQAIVDIAAEQLIAWHNRLAAVAASLAEPAESGPRGFTLLDPQITASDMAGTETFVATRRLPDHLLHVLSRVYRALGLVVESFPDWEHKMPLLHLWFDLAFFLRIGLTQFNDTYLLTLNRENGGDWLLSLQCLDASEPMCRSVADGIARVYFSATLSPLTFFLPQLSLPQDDVETLMLPSPFAGKNRLVLASDVCSIRYKDRQESLPLVTELIRTAVSRRTGNYLVFAPSFAYLKMLRARIESSSWPADWDLMFQTPGMSNPARAGFLNRFNTYGAKTLVAFAVIGSLFNEGVDLTGSRLIGVVVVGTGLPGISPERTLMGEYYQHRLGDGFRFAYVYPGFNRVLQAAGRLIRSETDRGFILLIDDRYKRDDYRQLLPEEWQTRHVGGAADIAAHIDEFWAD